MKFFAPITVMCLFASSAFAGEVIQHINLKNAIDQGLRLNYDENLRQFDDSMVDITLKRNRDKFWLPNLRFELSVTDTPIDALGENKESRKNTKYFGTAAIGVAEYTLFNWGKDYLSYLNTKDIGKRQKENNDEARRELRLQIIDKYLQVLTWNNVVESRKERLRQSSFIYRFNKDKAGKKKLSRAEYYKAKSEFLQAQNRYQTSKNQLEMRERELGELINTPVETRFKITEKINFVKIKATLEELLTAAEKNNPAILDANTAITVNDREYTISKKELLPLPKITLNVGAYKYDFGDNYADAHYANSHDREDVELSASLNATWDILGEEGLFNVRKRQMAVLQRNKSIKAKDQRVHVTKNKIVSLYKKCQHLEKLQDIIDLELETRHKSFDVALDNYTAGRSGYNDVQKALDELADEEMNNHINRLEHSRVKLELAINAGLDNLPGENLENLTKAN